MWSFQGERLIGLVVLSLSSWLGSDAAVAQSLNRSADPPVILNVAPQDREVFLTWSLSPDAVYAVRWRRSGDRHWNTQSQGAAKYAAIDSLENDLPYEFQLVVGIGDSQYLSQVVTETPRVRDDCGYGSSMFCTQDAFIAALPKYGLMPSALRCDGQPVEIESLLQNCRFTGAGIALGLDRDYGSVFSPNDARPDAETVSRVVRRVIWGSNDFEAISREYADRATEVAIPYGGTVGEGPNIKSYLVRIAPGLFSRVSWYSRPDHVPGRYAIYHEGHGEAGISSASDVLDWLLANGWQVISLDMPLEGTNEEDRQFPLYDHDAFASLDRSDFSALRFFFIPLVSVIDLIERDAKPTGRPTIMLLGRSGGGWSAFTYAAMDRRVDVSVNIAGGAPASTMLDSTAYNRLAPHYENHVNYLTDQASLTDIMLAGGRRAAFFFYSQNDPCCYRFSPDNEWIKYLQRLSESRVGKRYRVFLDNAHKHGMSKTGLDALGGFLTEIGLGSGKMRPTRTTQSLENN